MKTSKISLSLVALLFSIIGTFGSSKITETHIAQQGHTPIPCVAQTIDCDGFGAACKASNSGNVYDVFTDTTCQTLDLHSGGAIPF